MSDLKSCPFCSGKAYMERWEMAPFEKAHILEKNDGYFYAVVCKECYASSGSKVMRADGMGCMQIWRHGVISRVSSGRCVLGISV